MASVRMSAGPFAIIPHWVLEVTTANGLQVYARLASYANQADRAFPSRETLAKMCRMSTATLDRAIKELVAGGVIRVERRKGARGTWAANAYVLNAYQNEDTGRKGAEPAPVSDGYPPVITGDERSRVRNGTGDELTRRSVRTLEDPDVQVQLASEREVHPLVDLWNRTTTAPFPKVEKSTSARTRQFERALKWEADLDAWRRLFVWMNGQGWMRARGKGDHANWIASLDWLTKSVGTVERYMAQSTNSNGHGPVDAREAAQRTRDANIQHVLSAGLPFIVGGGS